MSTTSASTNATKSGHVAANGLSYYYEVHGQGEPVLLLHGGFGSLDMFGPVLTRLAAKREVIGVDLQGHGRTELGERKIDMADMADDMAVVLAKLGYDRGVDVMGYSLGSAIAIELAVRHPERVRRLVLVSACFATDGVYPEMLHMQDQMHGGMAEMMKDTPMYKSYAAVASRPEDFPKLLDRMGDLMKKPFDAEDKVKLLAMPVMLVYGDGDMFKPDHIVRFYQLLGGWRRDPGWNREHMPQNRLAILPDLTHYDIFLAPELVDTVLPFLNGMKRSG